MYYICLVTATTMIVKFDKEYLSELYYKGKCKSKKYRFQPNIVELYKRRIDILNDSTIQTDASGRGIERRVGISWHLTKEVFQRVRHILSYAE